MISWISLLRLTRLVLSLALVSWVGGAGCLIGCESLAMAAMDKGASHLVAAAAISGESCVAAANHSCCARHRASSSHQQIGAHPTGGTITKRAPATMQIAVEAMLPTSDGTVHTCPLAMNGTALSTNSRTDESSTQVACSPVTLRLVDVSLSFNKSSPLSYFNNRGHTYLRCCVFLI